MVNNIMLIYSGKSDILSKRNLKELHTFLFRLQKRPFKIIKYFKDKTGENEFYKMEQYRCESFIWNYAVYKLSKEEYKKDFIATREIYNTIQNTKPS